MSDLKIGIDSIDQTKKDLLLKLDDITSKYDYILEMVEDSKNLFDSETAKYLREKIFDNVKEQKNYINNEFKPFINELDVVKEKYSSLYNDIKKEVS